MTGRNCSERGLCTGGTLGGTLYVTLCSDDQLLKTCGPTTGFEKLVAVAGFDSLLAEAAYELVKGTQVDAVQYLAHHTYLRCIDCGLRGELVAALTIMLARDVARVRRWSAEDGSPSLAS